MKQNLFKKLTKPNAYFSLMLSFAVPALIIGISLIFVTFFNFNTTKTTIQNSVVSSLSQLSHSSEANILSIIDNAQIIGNIPILRENLENDNTVFSDDLRHQLNRLKNVYKFIDEIYIINKNTNSVCSSHGIYNIDDFFGNKYVYKDYNSTYWNDFQLYKAGGYRILLPSSVKANNKSTAVIPIAFKHTANLHMKNLIVFNIKLSYIVDHNYADALLHSSTYLMNKLTGEVFPSSSGKQTSFPVDFLNQLLTGTSRSFDYKLNDTNAIITMYSPNNTLSSYTYFTVTPSWVVTRQMLPNIILSSTLIILALLMTAYAIRRNTLSFYTPLQNIIKILSGNNVSKTNIQTNRDILKTLTSYAIEMRNTNQSLESVFSCAQEQYLISYLNSTEHYIDSDKRDIIKKSLPFRYDLFAVVIIRISPTSMLFDVYNGTEYINFQNGFYDIIKNMFLAEFQSFVLPGDNETLYTILNFETPDELNKVNAIFNHIYSLLQFDMEYINLSIGKSSCFKGLVGLKEAHNEATALLTPHPDDSHRISFHSSSINQFNFDSKAEANLYTSLFSVNREKTYSYLEEILAENANISPFAKKQLYTCILNIVLKIIRIKKLPYSDSRLDFEILSDFLKQPIQKIHESTTNLIDFVLLNLEKPTSHSSTNAANIIRYIDENYNLTDLSLEHLAGHFHTNASNVSVIVKEEIGVNFYEYLTTLRVNHAKQLLLDTDKNIESISIDCGFGSKQTFYRTFKKVTGQTPTLFRKSV